MELTVKIDMANTSATLVERHSLVAGDNYNPLNFDLSSLTAAQLAAVDLATLSVIVKKTAASATTLASSNVFTNGTQTSSGGTATVLPKIKKTTLLLNTQAVKDWFDTEAASANPNFQQTVYFELSDTNATYAACTMPFILRTFTVGSSTTGYYTKAEVDALLAAKQGTVTATSPLSKSAQNALSVGLASTSDFGVVKIGDRLTVTNGVLSATDQTPTTDPALDDDSTNAVQNKPVAEAFEGVTTRLDALLKTTAGVESGRVKTLETQMSAKADTSSLSTVATSGSYNDLSDLPTIPDAADAAMWYQEPLTGDTATPTGTGYRTGDMILNGTTGDVYRVSLSGTVATATKVGNIKGPQGVQGIAGRLVKTYASITAMQNDFSTSSDVLTGELVMIDTGSPNDVDTGKLYKKGSNAFEYVADISGQRGNMIFSGNGITYSDSTVTVGNNPGFTYAYAGDKYINTGTNGGLFNCTTSGNATDSVWEYSGTMNGPQGNPGSPGAAGAAGAPGTKWIVGTLVSGTNTISAASSYTGDAAVDDLYFNSSECRLYKCTAAKVSGGANAVWSYVSDFGKSGTDGTSGNTWLIGTDQSAYTGTANEGDLYLNTTSGKVYEWTDEDSSPVQKRWVERGSLKGASGSNGLNGVQTYSGSLVSVSSGTVATAFVGTASVGDVYFNTTTGQVFRCTTAGSDASAVWTPVAFVQVSETEYDTTYVPASSMTPSGSAGSVAGVWRAGSGTAAPAYDVQTFQGGTGDSADRSAEFTLVMPQTWKATALKVKVVWTTSSGTVGNDVKFLVAASGYSDSSATALTSFTGTEVPVTDNMLGANRLHQTAASGSITVPGAAAGGTVHFKIRRDADFNSSGGRLQSDANVIGIVVQFEKDHIQTGW